MTWLFRFKLTTTTARHYCHYQVQICNWICVVWQILHRLSHSLCSDSSMLDLYQQQSDFSLNGCISSYFYVTGVAGGDCHEDHEDKHFDLFGSFPPPSNCVSSPAASLMVDCNRKEEETGMCLD
ncbi:uncharacterized protein V6R79_002288 [Siganus canaliculatus]